MFGFNSPSKVSTFNNISYVTMSEPSFYQPIILPFPFVWLVPVVWMSSLHFPYTHQSIDCKQNKL